MEIAVWMLMSISCQDGSHCRIRTETFIGETAREECRDSLTLINPGKVFPWDAGDASNPVIASNNMCLPLAGMPIVPGPLRGQYK